MNHHQRHQYALLLAAAAIAFTQSPAAIGQTLPTAAPSEPAISPAGEQALQLLRLAAAREQAEKRAQQADDLRSIHSQLSQMHAELQQGSPSPQRQDEMAAQVGGFAADVQAMAQSQAAPGSAELKDAASKLEAAQRELAGHDAKPNTVKPSMDAIAKAYDQTIGRAAHLAEVRGSVESLQKQLGNTRAQSRPSASTPNARKAEATLKAMAQRSGKLQSQLNAALGPESPAAKGFNEQVRDLLKHGSALRSDQLTAATTGMSMPSTAPAAQAYTSAAASSDPSSRPHSPGAGQGDGPQSPSPGQGDGQGNGHGDAAADSSGEHGNTASSEGEGSGGNGEGDGQSQAQNAPSDQPPTPSLGTSGMPGQRSDESSGEGQASEEMVTERVNEVFDALQKVSDEIDQQLAQLRQKDLLRAMGDEEVPPEYRDLVNAYFERLSKQASPAPAPARAPAPTRK